MYILILYFSLGYGQSELKLQEFSSKEHCHAAIQEVLQIFVNRMNTRLQMKTEPVPFLERIPNPINK